MGFLLQIEVITIDFDCQFKVHLKNSLTSTTLTAFRDSDRFLKTGNNIKQGKRASMLP